MRDIPVSIRETSGDSELESFIILPMEQTFMLQKIFIS